jgi:hypothetical protein
MVEQAQNSTEPTSNTQLKKLQARIERDGFARLPQWGLEWLYWNGGIYKVTQLSQAARREYKYHKPRKNYGVTEPIVLYQMGKVGSAAVMDALSQYDFDVPVYTFHTLTNFDEMAEFIKRTSVDPTHPLRILDESRRHRQDLFNGRWTRFNVITLVRSPIHRTVSAFFEHWGTSNPDFMQRAATNEVTVAELTDAFLHQYYHDTTDVWFDAQFRPVFDLDVYATPFDTAGGYQMYANAKARVLLMRYEDLNRIFTPSIHEFLGVPDMSLPRRNVSESKGYGGIYREFIQTARLPHEYVEMMHSTRYARHFYSPAELEQFAAFWTRAGT